MTDEMAGAMMDAARELRADPAIARLPPGTAARRARMRTILDAVAGGWGVSAGDLALALAQGIGGDSVQPQTVARLPGRS